MLSVTDNRGNNYQRVAGPTTQAQAGTQSIYYAPNIVAAPAGGTTVTVTFNAAVNYPDVRIAEYSGIDPLNPVDVTVSGTGTGTTSNSGSVTTTNANDLLVGANYVTTHSTGPGTGFTQRVITNPDGSILEDRIVTTTGSYSATAPLTDGSWIMQMVAFRAAMSGPPDTTAPTAPSNLAATATSSTQINLSWTASTDNVAVSGYQIERCQNAGCSNFALLTTVTTTSYSNTGLSASTLVQLPRTRRRRCRKPEWLLQYRQRHHADGARYHGADCTDEPGGHTDFEQCDQSELDRLDGQRGCDGLSGATLPGCDLHELRADRYCDRHYLSGLWPGSSDDVPLPGACDGCGGKPGHFSGVVNATTLAVPDTTPPTVTITYAHQCGVLSTRAPGR